MPLALYNATLYDQSMAEFVWVTDRSQSFVIHRAGCQHLRVDLDIAYEGEADNADAFLAGIRSWRTDECGFEEHFAIAKCAR